jgi:hypothetical protein
MEHPRIYVQFSRFHVYEPFCYIKEVGSWAFQFHCARCYNLLLTGSIQIPLTGAEILHMPYWTQSRYKKIFQFKFWKSFVGTIFWSEGYFSQKVWNTTVWTIWQFLHHQINHQYFFLINKYFTYIIYDTRNWGLGLTQMLHSSNLLVIFFQIELWFFKRST